MKYLSKILFCLLIFFVLTNSIFAVESITLKVGESQNRKLYIYNPSKSLTDNLDLKIKTEGDVNAWITTTQENRMTLEVLPLENKSIPISVIATGCTAQVCTGNVIFEANSSITGNLVNKQINVLVESNQPRKFIGAAPGLSGIYVGIIAMIGALVSIFAIKKQKKK